MQRMQSTGKSPGEQGLGGRKTRDGQARQVTGSAHAVLRQGRGSRRSQEGERPGIDESGQGRTGQVQPAQAKDGQAPM